MRASPESMDGLRHGEMALVYARQPRVDDLLVQLFLFLEAEHLARLFRQHARDAIERHVVIVRIE
jgi:hypothetical protein